MWQGPRDLTLVFCCAVPITRAWLHPAEHLRSWRSSASQQCHSKGLSLCCHHSPACH